MASLCEPGVVGYMDVSLRNCRKFKDYWSNIVYNLTMLLIFVSVLYTFLAYKFKGKLTQEEKNIRNGEEKKYFMKKLEMLSRVKQKNNMITELPHWDSDNV